MVELEVEVDKQFEKYISNLKMNSLPMVFMLGSLLASAAFSSAAAMNAALQLAVFALAANIPALITGRMSYVDLAWPFGLVTIGLSPLMQGVRRCHACRSKAKSGFRTIVEGSFTILLSSI